jgi:hypothetical protein
VTIGFDNPLVLGMLIAWLAWEILREEDFDVT